MTVLFFGLLLLEPVRRSNRMSRSARAVLTIALCLTAFSPAAAQVVDEWANKQFTFERVDANTVRLVGQVEVEGQGPNAGILSAGLAYV